MIFDHIEGNDKVKSYLTSMLRKERIGKSLLFSGPDGVGKALFAEAFATELLSKDDPTGRQRKKIESGNHPDLHIYKPEGKTGMHAIKTMRTFCEEVYMRPYEAAWNIFILYEAERMLPTAANALLKTFEEPPPQSLIILLSSHPEALLTTILSRCARIHFAPLQKEGREVIKKENKLIDFLAENRRIPYGEALKFFKEWDEIFEKKKKELDKELRKEVEKEREEMSAIQKASLEKEIEGAISLQMMKEGESFFSQILFWFRDLHLVAAKGDKQQLYYPEKAEQLAKIAAKGNLPQLEKVLKIVEECTTSLKRSIRFAVCIETLFLKLRLV